MSKLAERYIICDYSTPEDMQNLRKMIEKNQSTDSQILAVVGYNSGGDVTIQSSLSWIDVK